jgi:hypothetical protein
MTERIPTIDELSVRVRLLADVLDKLREDARANAELHGTRGAWEAVDELGTASRCMFAARGWYAIEADQQARRDRRLSPQEEVDEHRDHDDGRELD